MSGLVLAVGALMLAAGGYEMVAGNGDILSERGWSAFIAGSVLVAGGVVTMALGLAVRALDRLRGAILQDRPDAAVVTLAPQRIEPGSSPAAPIPAATSIMQPDLMQGPTFEQAPTAPVRAAAPIEHVLPHEAPSTSDMDPPHVEPHHEPPAPGGPEHDWLDHSFAELERELPDRHNAADTAPTAHPEPLPVAAGSAVTLPKPSSAPSGEPIVVHEEPVPAYTPTANATEGVGHDAAPHEAAVDHATVSAREGPVPAASPVIGRYESEGTSYVMYADGSIDAQSAAGVYRFASMAELKTFIES